MATYSSVLAWRIPGTGKPGGLPSMGSHRVGHNWCDLAAAAEYIHRKGNGTPLQYSCLETPMDGGAWKAAVHGVAEGQTRLSDFIFTFHFHALEKEMAPHSSVLAWRIPGRGEPGELLSMGLHRVGNDWSGLAAAEYIQSSFRIANPCSEKAWLLLIRFQYWLEGPCFCLFLALGTKTVFKGPESINWGPSCGPTLPSLRLPWLWESPLRDWDPCHFLLRLLLSHSHSHDHLTSHLGSQESSFCLSYRLWLWALM